MMTNPTPDAPIDSKPADAAAPADAPPDRLSVDPRSKFFDEATLRRGIGIRFNGTERHDVEAYCVSQGWIEVASARARDRRGQPLMIKLVGTVEAFFKPDDSQT